MVATMSIHPPCRQMVKDICTFKKIFLEEKELEQSAVDNWRYEVLVCIRILTSLYFVEYFVQTRSKALPLICS